MSSRTEVKLYFNLLYMQYDGNNRICVDLYETENVSLFSGVIKNFNYKWFVQFYQIIDGMLFIISCF